MTIEQRAACIADLAMPGAVRGALRRKRVYDKALQMLGELAHERGMQASEQVHEAQMSQIPPPVDPNAQQEPQGGGATQ